MDNPLWYARANRPGGATSLTRHVSACQLSRVLRGLISLGAGVRIRKRRVDRECASGRAPTGLLRALTPARPLGRGLNIETCGRGSDRLGSPDVEAGSPRARSRVILTTARAVASGGRCGCIFRYSSPSVCSFSQKCAWWVQRSPAILSLTNPVPRSEAPAETPGKSHGRSSPVVR